VEKLGMNSHPREDFDHPGLQEGRAPRRHMLYRIRRWLRLDRLASP
jgi:hypothetical protein